MTIQYFSYKEAMKYLGVDSYQGLNELIAEGLPVIKVGKKKKISKASIDAFMKKHEVVCKS